MLPKELQSWESFHNWVSILHETLINEYKRLIPKHLRKPDVIGDIAIFLVDLANHEVKTRTILSIRFQDWKFWALLFPSGDILSQGHAIKGIHCIQIGWG